MTEKSNTPAEFKDCWGTPPEIFHALNAEFCFVLDAAASSQNSLCWSFITELENTLETEWRPKMPAFPGYVWLNPPYSNPLPFVQKAAHESEANHVGCVMLLPADTSVGWFREAIKTASEIRFITGGRLAFVNAGTGKPVSGNSKGSVLIIWHPYPRTHCEMTTVERDALMACGAKIMKRAA